MSDLPLTAGELTAMRTSLESFLSGTAVLYSLSSTSDGQGGQTMTFTASGTVDARLAPEYLRGGERALAGRVAQVSAWILTIPQGTTIAETYQVVYDGVTYEVDEVLTRVPEELGRRVRLREVD